MRFKNLVFALALATLPITAQAAAIQPNERSEQRLSLAQKNASVQALMRSATECIARTVAGNPRFRTQAPHAELGDLIVASVPSCVGPVRAMIDAYDRFFGDGSGEVFFMGPYLDALPAAVSTLAARHPP